MEIDGILPTQLYISAKKYLKCSSLLNKNGIESYEPIPIKRIGSETFFTDGHTRALILWQNKIKKVEVYNDPDNLDWIAYLANLKWCREEKIHSISCLKNRIVEEAEYNEKWINRCDKLHKHLRNNPLGDLKIDFETEDGNKEKICDEILRSLPEWFGIENAIRDYTNNVKSLDFVTTSLFGKPVGFCALKLHYGINCELYVLGIFKEFQNRGIGSIMIKGVENFARDKKMSFLTVKTVSENSPDQNYARTRLFYTSCGFRPLEEFPTLWDKNNPCLYMYMPLSSAQCRAR